MQSYQRIVFVVFSLCSMIVPRAQGLIVFANRSLPTAEGSATYDAPIYGASATQSAALLRVKPDGTLTFVGATTFRTDANSMYFASSPTLVVDGVLPGETAVFMVRIYNSGTAAPVLVPDFDLRFQSLFFRSLALGGELNGVSYPVPKTTGLQSFDTGNVGPFGFDKNNQFLFEYLRPSANWTMPGVLDEIPANSTDLPMWRIYLPVDLIVAPDPYFGTAGYSLDLSSTAGPGHVSRTAAVTPGQISTLQFWLSGNSDPAFAAESPIKSVRVTVGGGVYVFSHDLRAEAAGTIRRWRQYQIPFIATAASEEVHFESLNNGQAGPLVDAVNVFTSAAPPAPNVRITANGEISWDSWARFKYRVEKASVLEPEPIWTQVGSEIIATEQVTKINEFVSEQARAFYRIAISAP